MSVRDARLGVIVASGGTGIVIIDPPFAERHTHSGSVGGKPNVSVAANSRELILPTANGGTRTNFAATEKVDDVTRRLLGRPEVKSVFATVSKMLVAIAVSLMDRHGT